MWVPCSQIDKPNPTKGHEMLEYDVAAKRTQCHGSVAAAYTPG